MGGWVWYEIKKNLIWGWDSMSLANSIANSFYLEGETEITNRTQSQASKTRCDYACWMLSTVNYLKYNQRSFVFVRLFPKQRHCFTDCSVIRSQRFFWVFVNNAITRNSIGDTLNRNSSVKKLHHHPRSPRLSLV